MIWTVVTFLLLVLVLTKAAWKPILQALEQREGRLKSDLERAEKANLEAEALRQRYEAQLAEAQRTIQSMVNQAKAEGEKTRSQLVAAAKEESEKIVQKGRRELAGETERLKENLRSEVAGLSLALAEKILNRSLDKKVQDEVLRDSLKNISEVK